MSHICVSLFGRLQIRKDGTRLQSSLSQKSKELLAYLLLHRREHPREKLATLLWEHGTTDRAKAYLRKALWKLRKALESDDESDEESGVVVAEGDWVRLASRANLWVDADVFEQAFAEVRDCEAEEMTDAQVYELEKAAALYTGDLLENWYSEWCLRERERLQNVLLRLLDRLTLCCEQREMYDTGIRYGLLARDLSYKQEPECPHPLRRSFCTFYQSASECHAHPIRFLPGPRYTFSLRGDGGLRQLRSHDRRR